MAYSVKSISNFMARNNISPEDIRYILRREERCALTLMDGRELYSPIPLVYFESYLNKEQFTRINKGIIVNNSQVLSVSGGSYLMTDGCSLQGRQRNMKEHTRFMLSMAEGRSGERAGERLQLIREKFQAFDDLPVPFCLVEMVFDPKGNSISFIFRYCNEMMERLERMPREKILNRSFYDIFENPERKWLAAYGDVARNGGIRVFRGYKEKLGKNLMILCYRPAPGYCGCLIVPEDWQEMIKNYVTDMVSSSPSL